jgi:hypothetical protein
VEVQRHSGEEKEERHVRGGGDVVEMAEVCSGDDDWK